jgi:tetratricopeptide (TPR) repeat protein
LQNISRMKTVHINKDGFKKELRIWLPEIKLLEKTNKQSAIEEYKKMAVAYPLNEEVYDRLMILYRKLNETDEELRIISKAIDTFEKSFSGKQVKSKGNPKIYSLSRSILKSMDLLGKNGKASRTCFRPESNAYNANKPCKTQNPCLKKQGPV